MLCTLTNEITTLHLLHILVNHSYKSYFSHCFLLLAVSSNGCPAGPDPVWDITWANTLSGERDTQSCPRSEGMFVHGHGIYLMNYF